MDEVSEGVVAAPMEFTLLAAFTARVSATVGMEAIVIDTTATRGAITLGEAVDFPSTLALPITVTAAIGDPIGVVIIAGPVIIDAAHTIIEAGIMDGCTMGIAVFTRVVTITTTRVFGFG